MSSLPAGVRQSATQPMSGQILDPISTTAKIQANWGLGISALEVARMLDANLGPSDPWSYHNPAPNYFAGPLKDEL